MAVLENEELVMKGLMGKRNLAHVTTDELTQLSKDLQAAKADNQAAIDAAVAAAVKETTIAANSQIASLKNAHAV